MSHYITMRKLCRHISSKTLVLNTWLLILATLTVYVHNFDLSKFYAKKGLNKFNTACTGSRIIIKLCLLLVCGCEYCIRFDCCPLFSIFITQQCILHSPIDMRKMFIVREIKTATVTFCIQLCRHIEFKLLGKTIYSTCIKLYNVAYITKYLLAFLPKYSQVRKSLINRRFS